MHSRVYETVERPSVCLSVCPMIRPRRAAGLLLSAVRAGNIDRQRLSRLTSLTKGIVDLVVRLVATATYTAINLSDKNPLNSHDKVASLTPATVTHAHTHIRLMALSGTIRVSRYQKGKTSLDFTEARDSEWQCHQLGHMQTICTSLQTDSHCSTPPLSFLQAVCPSCRPTNSVKALKAQPATVNKLNTHR